MANPPLLGIDDGQTGYGVLGTSNSGTGTEGTSSSGVGVEGIVGSRAVGGRLPGVLPGGKLPPPIQAGVLGRGQNPPGKSSGPTYGVYGSSISGGEGVYGIGANGVRGDDLLGQGPAPDRPAGTVGTSTSNYGVYGSSTNNVGVKGVSTNYDGVVGVTTSSRHAGVSATNTAGTAIFAQGSPAGHFQGDCYVSGDHRVAGDVILVNSSGDVAEDFDVEDGSAHEEPGTVLVINSNGKLCASFDPYDTRVAGVVSGAGDLKPAIVLQRIESCRRRSSVALIGKAFCKVDASFGSINAGDLLTTSSTPGHAMKVLDRARATGAILGKALRDLEDGQGLIPILVTPH